MSVYIKDMDMPTDCLACRIACDKENYGVIGRPPKCPLTEAKTGDLISRADAIEEIFKVGHEHVEEKVIPLGAVMDYSDAIKALPSADAVSREDYHNLLTASNDIDRALREYQAKEEQLSAEVEPKIDHDRDWIIGCIEHDGFIHTHRFDKANQIIHDALSADAVQVVWCKDCRHRYEEGDCTHYYWCRINDRPVDDDDFCAWGEESEEEV